jgi:outer membrane protein OmpA-like peptidoglycan-associated protein
MTMTPTLRPLVLAMLTATLSLQSQAALDEVQVRLLQQYALPLRWDNVERKPQWVGGIRPSYDRQAGLHRVQLAPGESTTVRVARGEQVRVWRADGMLDAADLALEFSLGSGLYQRLPAALSEDHHGLLSRMSATAPYLARISRPRQASSALEVALFISRREPLGELAPYREVIALPGAAVQMRRGDQAAPQRYWQITPGQPQEVRLQGPARYALENRLAYPAHESALVQSYRVHAQLDGLPLATLEFETSAETAYPVYVNRKERVMGRSEVGYLEIPPGQHLLSLDSTVPLVARLLQQAQPDYLFATLNQPLRTAVQVRSDEAPFRLLLSEQLADPARPFAQPKPPDPAADTAPLQLRLSPWLAQAADLVRASQDQALTPSEKQSAALRLVRDNARREGGLLGAALMQESALQHPENPAVQTVANDLFGFHTFYRDLLPRDNLTSAGQHFARFIPRDLHALGEQGRGITQGEQHLQALLDRIPGAFFTEIPLHSGSSPVDVQSSGADVKLTLPADVLFDTDQSALKPHYQSLLEEAAALIRAHRPLHVRVIGHTDSRASDSYNQSLSERRAQAVAGFLARHGINPASLQALGKGELQPRASNDSASGRQLNRRVEILLEGAHSSTATPRALPGYHRYALPARVEPSLLRVMVDASASATAEFLLQFDDAEPMRMSVVATPELPADEYAPAQGDAALEMLAQQFGRTQTITTAGPYAARRLPGTLVRPRIMEIPLPSEVREVRAWRSEPDGPALQLALQYRAAKPFSLSELEYLAMRERAGDADQALAVFRRTLQSAVAAESQRGEQELANHWLPLVRALRSEHKVFTAPVVAAAPATTSVALTPAQQAELQSQAQAAEREGRWLVALERWGELVRRAPAPLAQHALLAQAAALLQLGEPYLAELQLRSLALHAGEADIRQRAIERLDSYYQSAGDAGNRVALWATLTQQQPTAPHLRRLVENLVDNSEHELALAIGLALPEAAQPREHLLRAAYQLGWWQAYAQLVAAVPSDEQRALWQGLAAMSQGRIDASRQLFTAATSAGEPWRAALDSAQALAQRHQQPQPQDGADLQRWHSEHPGPFVWREEPQLVSDFAGSEMLYSIDRDAYSRAYLATADKPVRLQLMGPLRLRIEARPLHKAAGTEPLDGWLRLKDASGLRLLPISNNLPATGLQLTGRSELAPGRNVSGEFDFGPGPHEVELSAGALPVLLRILARRPEMAIPLAPPLSAQSWSDSSLPAVGDDVASCYWKHCAVLVPSDPQDDAYSRDLRHNQAEAREPRPPRNLPGATPSGQPATLAPAGERLPGMAWPEAARLAAGEPEAALAMHPGLDEVDALRRMTLLLWWSEQDPSQHARALVEAEVLGARYPAHSGLQSLLSRLSRDALWQPATGIQDSAGQRHIEVRGWQPESPALRVRKALMRESGASDQMLSGNGHMLFSLRNLRPSAIDLQLSQEEVAQLAPLPLQAFYQLDGGTPVPLSLSSSQPPHRVRVQVPAGDHTLRVGIQAPLANQFLRVRLAERGPTVPMTAIERPWHVATQREPLRLAVAGPAWLRIDELRDDKVESRYQWVGGDFETLTLLPSGQRPQALFRVHQRILAAGATPIQPRVTEVLPEPVPPPYARVEATSSPRQVSFLDGFRLGGQEDGTWSYGAQLTHRREPQGNANSQAEDFLQLNATHRYYDEDWRTYFRTDLLGRVRASGGPTLAVLESIEHRPVWTTLNFNLDASLYLQNPQGGLPPGLPEWSAALKGSVTQKRDIGPKTYHVPRLALFAREFSLGSPGNLALNWIDQDIYTRYKSTHRLGLELGDTLYHRPWLDTQWHAGASLVSNPDLNLTQPDQLGWKVGWQQLLGKVQIDASYQQNHSQSDSLRTQASIQRTWLLDASWSQWTGRHNRPEAGLQLRHDADTGAITGLLYFTWHDSNGRGYRDFRPGEIDFSDLRTRDLPPSPNNAMKVPRND